MSVTVPKPGARRERTKIWVDVPFTKAPTTSTGVLELSGYASTWMLDRDDEVVARDAFSKSLGEFLSKNPMLLWQHNMDWPIGTVAGAHTDDTGLFVTASVPDPGPNSADWQKGAYTAIRTGVVRTFSIGGYMLRDVKSGPEGPIFIIAEVELFEISVVSIPANADSIFEAAVKALTGERPGMTEKARAQMEQLLGFKAVSDPEIASMDEDARRERYEMLSGIFKRAHDADPPGYDSFRKIVRAKEAGIDPLRIADATILATKAFYHPEDTEPLDEKAGRAISAANKTKLQGVLDAHDDLAGHLIDAAKSMEAAAASHKSATGLVKDVIGVSDEDGTEDGDTEEDEAPSSPGKGVAEPQTKTLTSDIFRQLRQLGAERYGQPALGQQYGPSVYVEDMDLDEGFVVFCVYDDDERLLKVPILRGADGSIALGDGEAEVRPQTTYRPKAIGDAFRSLKTAAEGAMVGDGDGSDPPKPEAPDPKPSDVDQKKPMTEADIGDDDLEETMFSQAEFQKELAAGALVVVGQREGKLSGDGQIKGALANADLPFADRDRAWSGPAAKRRVHSKAKTDDGYDPAVLKQAYLWIDSGADASAVTSYRFIVADVVGGTLSYVPRGIFAAAAVVQGARGGTSEEIASAIKPRLSSLYAKMRSKFGDDSIKAPWEGDS